MKRAAVDDFLLLLPARDGATWPCGHPRTDINSQRVGDVRPRCRLCRRVIARRSAKKARAR